MRRRSAWAALALWLVMFALAGSLAGKLGGVEKNDASAWLPAGAESTRVATVAEHFSGGDTYPAVIVYDRGGARLDASDMTRAKADAARIAAIPGVRGAVDGPVWAQDGEALRTVVQIAVGAGGVSDVLPTVKAVRAVITGESLDVHVTGPAGYGADAADAFSGVGTTLLYVSLAVVVLILLLVYRSPVLWALPLICVVAALTVAEAATYLLARHTGLTVNSDSEFLLTVLVFGAGTDYALLLIARYRDELRRRPDRFEAMGIALRRSGPAIVASGATVVASLLCLSAADLASTASLGPVMAVGVALALCAMTTLLPAMLLLCGRWVFWPARPVPSSGEPSEAAASEPGASGRWQRLGRLIARRPRLTWLVTAGMLVVLAFGLTGLKAGGLQNKDTFTAPTDAVRGEQVLAAHFPASAGDPLVVVGPAQDAARLHDLAGAVPGVAEVSAPRTADGYAYLEATASSVTGTAASFDLVDHLRSAVHTVPGGQVGGEGAIALDTLRAARHDRDTVIPLVLVVILAVLCLLLRALVAPLVLLATVALSLAATLGVSALVFDHVFSFAGADPSFPLWAFVFLISLGIDYTVFLMTRVREEAAGTDTGRAAVRALGATGGTITAAGLVLAGTFSALTTLPLVFAVEIGFVVAFGVLLDTFVVRSVLVPALTVDLGERMWWPAARGRAAGRRDSTSAQASAEDLQPSAGVVASRMRKNSKAP
jgi:RND superfamily putative drug exporter